MSGANTSPIYTLTPAISWVAGITSANTAYDGTGSVNTIFTAGSNGSYVQSVRVKVGTANSSATVVRIFVNNGSTNSTAANNSLIAELSIPSTTQSNSAALPDFEIPINRVLPASYVLNATLGTAPGGSATIAITAFGGNY